MKFECDIVSSQWKFTNKLHGRKPLLIEIMYQKLSEYVEVLNEAKYDFHNFQIKQKTNMLSSADSG